MIGGSTVQKYEVINKKWICHNKVFYHIYKTQGASVEKFSKDESILMSIRSI